MIDSPSIYLGRAFSSVTWMRWEGGRLKRKVESCAASDVYRQQPCSCWDKYLECQLHHGKRLLWDTPCSMRIDLFSTSLHLNLQRLCFHAKWRPFPPPTSVPEHSWAWQLEAEFAERWHGAWLGCSLDSCPDRRFAAQVFRQEAGQALRRLPYRPVGQNSPHMDVCPDI